MKKNKKWIITSIILLIVIILALVGFMIYGIAKGGTFPFFEKTTSLYENTFQDITQINVDVTGYDVELRKSTNNEVTIEITGSEKNKDKMKVEKEDSKLSITQDDSIICIGLCLHDEKIIIYMPQNIEFVHTSSSGSLTSEVDLTKGSIHTTSGDILLSNIEEGELQSTSGNIKTGNSTNLNVSATSGDIELGTIANLIGSAKSGNVVIDEITNQIDFTTTSGDMEINKLNINEDSNISAKSGNVDIKLGKEIFIDATSKNGNIDIHNANQKPTLKITTTSGDITAK